MKKEIVVGTRGSKLALVQTQKVVDLLKGNGFPVIIRVIITEGDRRQDLSLRWKNGTGLFAGELEKSLLRGEIDLAVHSLKDLPVNDTPGLRLAAFLKRADPREAFVSNRFDKLGDTPPGAVIGSSSLRRVIQLQRLQPNCEYRDIRGNVDTRIRKMDEGLYDGVILAMAGLERLGLTHRVKQIFNPEECLPAPGQGTITVQVRETSLGQGLYNDLVLLLNDPKTAVAVSAERELLRIIGGGCRLPVGAIGEIDGVGLKLTGMVSDLKGENVLYHSAAGSVREPERVAKSLADWFVGKGIIDWY